MGVTPPQSPSVMPTGTVGVVMGSVDESGNVTLTPLDGSGAAAVSEAGSVSASSIYGTQNLNVHVYAAAATISTKNNTKTWTMKIGLRNFLPYPIGSNQAGTTPSDTTGIFLAVISGPTVSKTSTHCPGSCAMSTVTYDGTGNFTAPNQPYLYWRERLAPKQAVAGADTVSNRRTIQFTSPTQVTNFTFFLIVGADWPAPAQTSWSLFYNAATDSAPDVHAKPIWRSANMSFVGKASESWVKAAGADSLKPSNSRDYYLFRRDSLASSSSAYMLARVKVTNSGQGSPETAFGFLDGTRMVAVGMTNGAVGFVKYTYSFENFFGHGFYGVSFVGSSFNVVNTTQSLPHNYLLRKFGADSVTLEVDGVRRAGLPYNQLPSVSADNVAAFTTGPAEFFGDASFGGNHSSAWSVLTYGIGATQPQ